MKNITAQDERSKKFILVPFCLICQAFQARGIVRYGFSSVISPVLQEILDRDLNIVQMPCCESLLGGYEKGLSRGPKGIVEYSTIPEFVSVCQKQAKEVLTMVKGILANDYEVVAVLGMEYSPSCSVGLQYTHQGTIHRPGIFIESLQDEFKKAEINLPFLGINRRGVKSTVQKLVNLLDKKEQKELF